MQRWFFADEPEDCDAKGPPAQSFSISSHSHGSINITYRDWKFCVLVQRRLMDNEKLAVVGDCSSLGSWQFKDIVILSKEEDSNQWSKTVSIPDKTPVFYRYLICAIDPTTEQVIVRHWETHLIPRKIPENAEMDTDGCNDIFGELNAEQKVDRGYLTSETIVQLKFFNAPFSWKNIKNRLLYVKVTPMNLKITSGCDPCPGTALCFSTFDDSLSNDTNDTYDNSTNLSTAFAFNEVTAITPNDAEIKNQPQFGTLCGPTDLVIFHLTIGDFENTAYLIDLYTYSSKAAKDEPPYHLAYHYMLPNILKQSAGQVEVPITCATKHRPLGMMTIGYLLIKPVPSLVLTMEVSYSRYWNPKYTGLDVGHRGLGPSFKTNDSLIRENTIFSLKFATQNGADMVEFDVQLSKDLVPVIYHDFMIYVSLKSKNSKEEHEFLQLPMRDLTLEQLKKLLVYHTAEGRSKTTRCFKFDNDLEHQPFPTLAEALELIDPHIGFNIEVKWSQKFVDGTMEEGYESVIDRNLYIDCILDVVFQKADERRIVFSCFDADICVMLRFKQNRFPVMFLTQGITTRYKSYMDPRCSTIESAVFHSLAMELLGVVAHTEDLLRDPSQINLAINRGLVLFCWGEDNNSKEIIKQLKDLGLHAIIYDKIDKLTTKEVKESVFLLQAKESQREILQLQAQETFKSPLPRKSITLNEMKNCYQPKERLPCKTCHH